jgi:hypothetical protein
MALLFAQSLPDFLQFFRAIFRFFPNVLADKNWSLGLGGQHDTVAGACINFDHLGMNLVLGLEDDPGEVSITAQGVDHDPLHLDVESIENKTDELVGQWALVMLPTHRHGNGATDTWLNMDDKAFFVVADENGQGVLVCGENAKNLHPHDIRVHNLEVPLVIANDNDVTAKDKLLICSERILLTRTSANPRQSEPRSDAGRSARRPGRVW